MRRLTGYAALVAATFALVAGCQGCASVPGSLPDLPPSACVATYMELPGGNQLGFDGCGNSWLKTAEGCFIMDDSLEVLVPIACPADGDTLAVIE